MSVIGRISSATLWAALVSTSFVARLPFSNSADSFAIIGVGATDPSAILAAEILLLPSSSSRTAMLILAMSYECHACSFMWVRDVNLGKEFCLAQHSFSWPDEKLIQGHNSGPMLSQNLDLRP
jgi:hypothetical protein